MIFFRGGTITTTTLLTFIPSLGFFSYFLLRDLEENEAQDEEVKHVKGRNFGVSSDDADFSAVSNLADAVSLAGARNVQSGLGKLRFDGLYFSKLPEDLAPLATADLKMCEEAMPDDVVSAVACLANIPVICGGVCDVRSR